MGVQGNEHKYKENKYTTVVLLIINENINKTTVSMNVRHA